MAELAPRPCTWPGCGELVAAGGACPLHRQAQERRRGKTAERGYDGDHRRLRAAVLGEFPVCQLRIVCDGAVATDLDHIIPIERRPDLRLERSNVQSSCGPCNVAKAHRKARKSAVLGGESRVFVSV
jgi:5-methylcytosine-specific restriction protein A